MEDAELRFLLGDRDLGLQIFQIQPEPPRDFVAIRVGFREVIAGIEVQHGDLRRELGHHVNHSNALHLKAAGDARCADRRIFLSSSQSNTRSTASSSPSGSAKLELKWIGAVLDGLPIGMNNQFHPQPGGLEIAKLDHFPELIGGIDVQQRERDGSGMKRLLGQSQHHGRIFANRVQHHRSLKFARDLPKYMNTFGFQSLKMAQRRHLAIIPYCPST
jgi:hypothetical protein